jgi:hypothetical protein
MRIQVYAPSLYLGDSRFNSDQEYVKYPTLGLMMITDISSSILQELDFEYEPPCETDLHEGDEFASWRFVIKCPGPCQVTKDFLACDRCKKRICEYEWIQCCRCNILLVPKEVIIKMDYIR